ncbi:MAG: stalk domain-containing protein [Armatimonadota bacterium]
MTAMRSVILVAALTVLLLAAVAGSSLAGTATIRGMGEFGLKLHTSGELEVYENTLVLRGKVAFRPDAAREDVLWAFYVDGASRYSTDRPAPLYELDTTTLEDGDHALRVDAIEGSLAEGEYRIASTGTVAVTIANVLTPATIKQGYFGPQPGFVKIYRKPLKRHAVWFNGREGDLELHATNLGPNVRITLTDLIRHIGGTVEWGPTTRQLVVHRLGTTVKLRPGSSVVWVNGVKDDLGARVVMKANRNWVPVRGMCRVLGVDTAWNAGEKRMYVSY